MKGKKKWIVLIAVLFIAALGFGAYQVYRFPDTFRSLSDRSMSEEEVSALAEQMRGKEDKKVLVAYFSYSGTTKGVAGAIGVKRFQRHMRHGRVPGLPHDRKRTGRPEDRRMLVPCQTEI